MDVSKYYKSISKARLYALVMKKSSQMFEIFDNKFKLYIH